MRLLDMATGNDYPIGDYQLVSAPPCWRLFSPSCGTTMLVSASHFSLETDPPEPEPEVGYEVPPPPTPPVEPEPLGQHLGECNSLPPMASPGDRIYHLIDRREYRYTPNGWVPEIPPVQPEPAPESEEAPVPEPEPKSPPRRRKR